MTIPKKLADFLTIRINRETAVDFRQKSKDFGGTSTVLRELVEAFVDDRITIKPDPKRKTLFTQEM